MGRNSTGWIITSLIIIAVGAIARYAIFAPVHWLNLATAGAVAMTIGIIGLVLSVAAAVAEYVRRLRQEQQWNQAANSKPLPPHAQDQREREVIRERHYSPDR